MATFKLQHVLSKIEDNGQQRVIPVPDTLVSGIEYVESANVINDDSLITPVTFDLTSYEGVNHLVIWATYKDDDLPNNIKAGDLAPFEFELNNSGIYQKAQKPCSLGIELTSLKYRKKGPADSKKIKVHFLLSAVGI